MTMACPVVDDDVPDLSDLAALELESSSDTLLILAGNQFTFNVIGSFIEVTENTISNSGAIIDTYFVDITSNTTEEIIDGSILDWFSSNSSVASVNKGTITAVSKGNARIWAEKDDISSNSIIVKVNEPDLPPELVLAPPPFQLVFEDTTTIKGWVTPGMNLTLAINNDSIDPSISGHFEHGVSLATGVNEFKIKATNNANGLSSSGKKIITYLTFDEAGITGSWHGETLTRPFAFEISNYSGTYIIDGTLTVDVTILGGPMVVQDIIIAGLIYADGTIDATASLDDFGFIVTGTLDGIFLDSGTSQGEYSLKIKKEGILSVSAKASWTADRD